jgi:uncharacterized protein
MTLSRALALPLILLVKAYQLLISPLTGASCRFYPSCSAYALTALERYGLVRGTWLTVRRLLRCHPWNPGGVDHVPERQEQDAPSVYPVVTGHRHHPVTDR